MKNSIFYKNKTSQPNRKLFFGIFKSGYYRGANIYFILDILNPYLIVSKYLFCIKKFFSFLQKKIQKKIVKTSPSARMKNSIFYKNKISQSNRKSFFGVSKSGYYRGANIYFIFDILNPYLIVSKYLFCIKKYFSEIYIKKFFSFLQKKNKKK